MDVHIPPKRNFKNQCSPRIRRKIVYDDERTPVPTKWNCKKQCSRRNCRKIGSDDERTSIRTRNELNMNRMHMENFRIIDVDRDSLHKIRLEFRIAITAMPNKT